MPELPVSRPIERTPIHPGELMREILDEQLRLPTAEAAQRMHIPQDALEAVLAGAAAVTPEMALRFGRLAGAPPELYLQMQAQRDLWTARERLKDALAAIEPAG